MKCINEIIDILGINNIVFNNSKDFNNSKKYHLEVGYYELDDKIGSNDIKKDINYCYIKSNEELLQLALRILGGTNILDVEKLINTEIITTARIQSKYDGHKDIKHTLIIEGFSPGKALEFISKNAIKKDIQIMSVYQVFEGLLSNEKIKIIDISNDINFTQYLLNATKRQTIRAKESINKSYETIKSLEPELSKDKVDFSLKDLKEMFETAKDIQIELKKYIDMQLSQKCVLENETEKLSDEEEANYER